MDVSVGGCECSWVFMDGSVLGCMNHYEPFGRH